MAIRKTIFRECSNPEAQLVFQYNDLYFTPGFSAFYNGTCYLDTTVSSTLIPVADVTFNGYEDCDTCVSSNLSGITLQNCVTGDFYIATVSTISLPSIGQVVYMDQSCWLVISYTNVTSQIQNRLSVFETCEDCLEQSEITEEYQLGLFINCCASADTKTFNIIPSNFGYPFGSTVVYNSTCYYYNSSGTPGIGVATYSSPDFYDCRSCSGEVPCASPTPSISVTPTPTRTPSVTPTISVTPSFTPSPSKTPGLTPSPSYTATTTTRRTEKNECEPITLFPLGVECDVVDPTTWGGGNGSVSLTITGGTAPYTIVWNTGVTGVSSLTNLVHGTYSATVIDYWGDFTGTTECDVMDPTPSPTPSPSITPTPSATPAAQSTLCLTVYVGDFGPYQFEFTPYTTINGYPAWSASTTTTPVTTGSPLFLRWNNPGPSLSPTPTFGYWSVTGWDASTQGVFNFSLNSSTTSVPPVSGWNVVGTSPNVTNPTVVTGACPTYTALTLQSSSNNASCAGVTDGSICLIPVGGSGTFEYSIDGGTTYSTTNCFFNLGVGSYACIVKDLVTLNTASTTVTVGSNSSSTSVQIGFTQTSSTIVTNTNFTQTKNSSYSMNTSTIPNGVTLNISFTLTNEEKWYQPGSVNHALSSFVILKNGVAVTQTAGGSSTLPPVNRPGCNPNKIETTIDIWTASVSVTNSDTLVINITNNITIDSAQFDLGCSTRGENTMSVAGSFTYSGVSPCVTINSGNMTVTSFVSRTYGG